MKLMRHMLARSRCLASVEI